MFGFEWPILWLTLKPQVKLGVIRSDELFQSTQKMMHFKITHTTFNNVFIYNVNIIVIEVEV